MCIAAAIAGTALVGAAVSSNAAGKAADAQINAANAASATQQRMYDQTRADQAPWRAAGGQAVNALSQYYGLGGIDGKGGSPDYQQILENLPGYQFQRDQGNKAVQQNLAARGLLNSGAAGKALQQYGQGLAQNYGQQYAGGLQSLAGLGQNSVQATGQAGANAANQIGSNQIYAGNAQASGYANQANAWQSGLSGISGAFGMYQGGGGGGGYGAPLAGISPLQSTVDQSAGFNALNPITNWITGLN
jgi:hypothetical protein